jgi:hypothetical protein
MYIVLGDSFFFSLSNLNVYIIILKKDNFFFGFLLKSLRLTYNLVYLKILFKRNYLFVKQISFINILYVDKIQFRRKGG